MIIQPVLFSNNQSGNILQPIHYDIDNGYVLNNEWRPGGTTVTYSDVYRVEANKHYILALGEIVGTRFRSIVVTEDPYLVDYALTGVIVSNVNNPNPYAVAKSLAHVDYDGYLVVVKDNDGLAGLKSFLFCLD